MLVIDHFWHLSFPRTEKVVPSEFRKTFKHFFRDLLEPELQQHMLTKIHDYLKLKGNKRVTKRSVKKTAYKYCQTLLCEAVFNRYESDTSKDSQPILPPLLNSPSSPDQTLRDAQVTQTFESITQDSTGKNEFRNDTSNRSLCFELEMNLVA